MENIILTNNKDLRLVSVKVGVLSTLRFELPLVSASATHVEVIVTSGDVPSAYTATFIDATKRWQCDIAASQFPTVGRQSYEVAYVLDGKQFWDGKGWIEIEDATTSGIEPQPRPEPYRYVVVSVNGYGADAQGAVRIPKTFIATDSPVTTEGYIEGDIYFNSETGATWTLCSVQGTLTWVFNYKNYYTKTETDEAIDRVAAYYITYDAAGNPFPTYASLANATTVYSGGSVRVPTRNDYCVVLADETHQGAEYRYIYAVAEGQTTGSWQPQFPVEGVMTVDQSVTKNSKNPVSGGGVWSALWGALSALPTGFTSLYDWCVNQLAGKASTADATLTERRLSDWSILHTPLTAEQKAAFYAESEFAASDDYKVTIEEFAGEWHLYVGGYLAANVVISGDGLKATFDSSQSQEATTIWGPNGTTVATRTALQGYQLGSQTDKPLASEEEAEALRTGKLDKSDADWNVSYTESGLRIADTAGMYYIEINPGGIRTNYPGVHNVFWPIDGGTSALLENLTGNFSSSTAYAKDALVVYMGALYRCVNPNGHTGAWVAADFAVATVEDILAALRTAITGKADASDLNAKLDSTSAAPAFSSDSSVSYAVGSHCTYNGKLYKCTTATTGGTWDASKWTADMASNYFQYSLVAKTIDNGAVTLDDRAINAVAVSSSLASLTVNFPTATSGKVRDFGLRLTVASGVTTAPQLVLPQGVVCENADGEAPEIGADGAATILYFTETASGVFLVKGEVVTAIS